MRHKKFEWEELEKIVEEIQKFLAPDAVVRHNHNVIGKSGRRRKLDVTITQAISSFPVFIVIDCKHHSEPVQIRDVEAFSGQLEDVSGNLGVMISSSGFDAGAKSIAKQKGIILQIYRKAGETDWKKLLGENAWLSIIGTHFDIKALMSLTGDPVPIEIPLNKSLPIFDENGNEVYELRNIFLGTWDEMGRPICDINGLASFEGLSVFIKREGELIKVQNVVFNGRVTARKFIVNLNMAGGNVIEDDKSGETIYRSVFSEGFEWGEIVKNQSGIEIDNEEYQRILINGKLMNITNAKRFIRLVAQDKSMQK